MNTPQTSDSLPQLTQNELDRVLDKIGEIAKKSVNNKHYIYRGESECHDEVCSGLYRAYDGKIENPNVKSSQEAILDKVKKYLPEIDKDNDPQILTQLQHFGCTTNLIDFTTDCLVALFFACGDPDYKNGRVILLEYLEPKPKQDDTEQDDKAYTVIRTLRMINRVESQKSIFVESPTGVIKPDHIVEIPTALKKPMREFLRKNHGISSERIYNDIHGFIQSGDINPRYLELHSGKEMMTENIAEAIKHYSTALELEPNFVEGYVNRGLAYANKGDYDTAIKDYSKAIDRDNTLAEFYRYRGDAYANKDDYDTAIKDYDEAIKWNSEDQMSYYNRSLVWFQLGKWENFKSDWTTVAKMVKNINPLKKRFTDLAEKRDLELPKDIAEMLAVTET